ncbi:unnamed protein product [Staurois parvus]|uniref:Uncharacterized protein n=1 Tax=Staurois parvus TaxID=386267 RepID=A0ABN9AJB3_9NEOB|nr:unnamed protein product [Staurois parvus]
MYTHTHVRTYTQTHTCTCTHTDTCTYTQRHVQIHTCTYTQTHVQLHMHTQTHTNTHTCTPPPPHKKLQYFVVHSQIRVLQSRGGREHRTHSLLCFHCAELLSILMAPSANDRSGLSSEPAQQDGPGGHTRPHHNFHSPLASRRVGNFKP